MHCAKKCTREKIPKIQLRDCEKKKIRKQQQQIIEEKVSEK